MLNRISASSDKPLTPDEISFLQHVFDSVLADHDLARDGERARMLAAAIIRFYMNGAKDEKSLMKLAQQMSCSL